MGNAFNNNNNNENNQAGQIIDQNQQLIQGNDQDISLLIDAPSIKNVYAVKNPIYLHKETLVIEKDSENKNIYYIKFKYDSLCYFNLYINFNVKKNPSNNDKKLLPDNDEKSINKYAYIPSSSFEKNAIEFFNLPPGQNVEFFEKKACFDISYFNTNKSRDNSSTTGNNNYINNNNEISNIIDNTNNANNNDNNNNNNNNNKNPKESIYDICIEMHSLTENENSITTNNESLSNKNKVIFVSLCKIVQEDNQLHNYVIHCETQKLKTLSMWIELFDVFNCALESGECLICCSNIRNTIFLPCKHSCTCNNCAHSLRMRNNPCPICKNNIDDLLIIEVEDDSKNENSNKINIDNSNNPFIKNNDVENLDEEDLGNEINNNQNNNFDTNNGMNKNVDNENNVRID